MKKEINLVKKSYLGINPPEFLQNCGVESLWNRVDENPGFRHFHFSKIIIVAILVFIIISLFAYPESVLHPVRVLSEKAIKQVKENLNFFIPPQVKSPTPVPEISPMPTSDDIHKQNDNQGPKDEEKTEEIKGVSSNVEYDENSSPQDHNEGKSQEDSSANLEDKKENKNQKENNNNSDKSQSDEKKSKNFEEKADEQGENQVNASNKGKARN